MGFAVTDKELSEENARLRDEITVLRLRSEKAILELQVKQTEEMASKDVTRETWVLFSIGVAGTLGLLYVANLLF